MFIVKRNFFLVAAVTLLVALCGTEAARARPFEHRDRSRRTVVSTFRTHRVRTPVAVPWHLRHHREFGWVHGLHGGYHWAPGFGWHNLFHRGYYRVDDGRVFLPAPGDWRSRRRF